MGDAPEGWYDDVRLRRRCGGVARKFELEVDEELVLDGARSSWNAMAVEGE